SNLMSHPPSLTYLTNEPHQTLEDTLQFIEQTGTEWSTGPKYNMGIVWKETGELVGTLAIIDEGGRAYFGYAIYPGWRGRGIATEASRWAIQVLLQHSEVFRIYAYCDSENEASKAVLRKAGLVEEATLYRWMRFPNQGLKPKDCTFFYYPMPT
ncbi:MAG: GNAT family N-acetyltransferase, partial [Bacteroidota bacterium]